jgi:RNA-directed DNA polymerase
MRAGHAQYVTGLSVNDPSGPHIPRHVKRFLRLEIHHVAVSGFAASSLGKRKLLGHINNVKHVNPDLALSFMRLLRPLGC